MILQHDNAEDWVIATGITTSIRDFRFEVLPVPIVELEFNGGGIDEKAYIKSCSNSNYNLEIGKEVLAIDERYFRPTEVDLLIGDPTTKLKKN